MKKFNDVQDFLRFAARDKETLEIFSDLFNKYYDFVADNETKRSRDDEYEYHLGIFLKTCKGTYFTKQEILEKINQIFRYRNTEKKYHSARRRLRKFLRDGLIAKVDTVDVLGLYGTSDMDINYDYSKFYVVI